MVVVVVVVVVTVVVVLVVVVAVVVVAVVALPRLFLRSGCYYGKTLSNIWLYMFIHS